MLALEKEGVVKVANKRIIHESGVYVADVIWGDIVVEGKTFFPSHWPQEKVMEEILYSLDNLIERPSLRDQKCIFYGISKESIKIQTVIEKSGYVITSFPRYRKFI